MAHNNEEGDGNGTELRWQLALAKDIGAIKEGVGSLKVQTGRLDETVGKMREEMVKRTDCQNHMRIVEEQVRGALAEAQAATATAEEASETADEAVGKAEVTARHEIARLQGRSPSSMGHAAIGSLRAPDASAPPAAPVPPTSLSSWEKFVKHAQSLTAVITFVITLGGILFALVHFVTRVENALKHVDEQQQVTQAALKRLAPHPDAAVKTLKP